MYLFDGWEIWVKKVKKYPQSLPWKRCNGGTLEEHILSWTKSFRCLQQPTCYISGSHPNPWAKSLSSSHASFSHWRTWPGCLLIKESRNIVCSLYTSGCLGSELRRQGWFTVVTGHIRKWLVFWIWKYFPWHIVLGWILCRLFCFSCTECMIQHAKMMSGKQRHGF